MAHDDDAAPTESLAGFTATGPSDALAETMQASATPGPDGAATTVERGARIGRYVIDEVIGAGGMGVVYRARDPALDRVLAIKLVRTARGGSAGRARLLREAQAMAKLRHPNVVSIFDVGPTGDGVFVVMPCLDGGTLGEWVRGGPRSWREVIAQFAAAGRGLVAAHAAGLVHRDFKPDNVLLGAAGEVAVADFGLARIGADELPSSGTRQRAELGNDLTRTGDILGTPAYMAPEQMRGEPSDARADQFSFCVALWEALYGRRPFDAGEERGAAALRVLLEQITAGKLVAPSTGRDVPGWVRATLERGLRADPDARWPSMQALLAALGGPRHRRGLILGGAAAAIVAGGVAIALASSSPARAPVEEAPAGPVRLRLEAISTRGDVTRAALSPDGKQLAVVAGKRLVLRAPDENAEETVLARDVSSGLLDWSPDGTRLLVTHPGGVGATFALVDVRTQEMQSLPIRTTVGAFTSDTEVATAYVNRREVRWVPLAAPETPSSTCEVPGTFMWINALDGVATGELVVTVTEQDATWAIVVDRACAVRATIRPARMLSIHVDHASGELVTLSTSDGDFELQAWSLDGEARGRPLRGHGGALEMIGHQGDRALVVTAVNQTHLVRQRGAEPPVTLVSSVVASFAFSPDFAQVAWVDRQDGWEVPGVLRVDALDRIDLRAGKLLEGVESASWSLDGSQLAAVVDDDGTPRLTLVDAATGKRTTLALADIERESVPVWITPARVAIHRLDHSTYDWIDVATGERGTVVDPALGWPFYLTRSPRDGTLAFGWNQGEGLRLWTQDAAGLHQVSDELLVELPAFAPDGTLLLAHPKIGLISAIDPRTAARRELARHELDANEWLMGFEVSPSGDYLLTVVRLVSDVVAATPDP